MNQKRKEYFFYVNTDEYKIIKNGLDWSIILIIYCCIFHFCIDYNIDFILNIIVAITIGYIISYFYFYLITLKIRIYQEKRAIEILSVFCFIFKENEIDIIHYTERIKRITEKNTYFDNWDIIVMNMNVIRYCCDIFLNKNVKTNSDIRELNEILTQKIDFIINAFEDKIDMISAMDKIKNIRTDGTKRRVILKC